jgi:hypothetical protein
MVSQEEIEKAADRYRTWLVQANDYAKAHGARFCHFLEPHLYTGQFTPWEKRLTDNPLITDPGGAEARNAAYSGLQAVARDLAARASAIDACLDDRARRRRHLLSVSCREAPTVIARRLPIAGAEWKAVNARHATRWRAACAGR